jgi:hypothetical protein
MTVSSKLAPILDQDYLCFIVGAQQGFVPFANNPDSHKARIFSRVVSPKHYSKQFSTMANCVAVLLPRRGVASSVRRRKEREVVNKLESTCGQLSGITD